MPRADREELARVLQRGDVGTAYMGWADCRICGRQLGTRDFFGYGFLWPEKAEHYVLEHDVWTPECDAAARGRAAIASEETVIAMADNRIDPTKSVALQCSFCGGVHEGVPALEKSLAELDPDAAVFFDRDVVEPGLVCANLCGPRFRLTNRTLLAHFGSPAGACYVVFRFDAMDKKWTVIIDTVAKNRRRVLVTSTDFPRR